MKSISLLIIIISISLFSQIPEENKKKLESNKVLYSSFQKFYTKHIRQEKKDEWGEPYYYRIDQINGVHYFDYNKDGLKDVLVEFSAAASDGGSNYFLTAVLFEFKNGNYNYIAHMDTNHSTFDKYYNSIFYFKGARFKSLLDENRASRFKLINGKFIPN